MMKLAYETVNDTELASKVSDQETLVVIPRSDQPLSKMLQGLKEKAIPSLVSQHHYAVFHSGFLAEGAKPFVLVEWKEKGEDALERRWVLNHLTKLLKARTAARRLAVYLPGQSAEQTVMAEDLFYQRCDAFYQETQWESFRVFVNGKNTDDVYTDIRFQGQGDFRRWVNENPDSLTSISIGDRLGAFCREHKCEFRVMDRDELKKENLNLLLAVGAASEKSPPRLMIASHNLNKKEKPLMLIGKGITFDTGGINLKPHESFVNAMKNDMGGAGLVAQLFMALVRSGYERPLVALIPSCENLIGENATKPGTIVKSRSGRTIFIEHTDAEGRLILSDAITYGHDVFQPALTISMATLTTASLRQYSHFYSGVHFANPEAEQQLRAVGDLWGEKFTFWPSFLPFRAGNNTSSATMTNLGRLEGSSGSLGAGGSSVAAHFLKEFTKYPFMHFDIFSSTWNWGGDYPGSSYGATGAPFNTVFHWLRNEKNLFGY